MSERIVIAGAGIGGLTAALAIARHGFPVLVLEQADRLEEIGAGIQLSPNAARVLCALGLRDALAAVAVVPDELRVMDARSGRMLARAPLAAAAERYGAPYWLIHRSDLQRLLREAAEATPAITIQLGVRVEDFAASGNGVTLTAIRDGETFQERTLAFVAADGLWSRLRARLGHRAEPVSARQTAWRALIPAQTVAPSQRQPAINLWLGRGAHVVHYPVRAGTLINVVAIVSESSGGRLGDPIHEPEWSAPRERSDLLAHFPADQWHADARALLSAAADWRGWALYDCAPLPHWGEGPVTLLGDAAHPMLPYLAQGAAMAIEDASVLGHCLAHAANDAAAAMRRYEGLRLPRTARAQRAARRNGAVYHWGRAGAYLRQAALRALGAKRLISRYDWLYGWREE